MGVKTLDIHVVCVCQPVLSFDMGVHCIDTHVTLHIHVSFSDIGVNHCLHMHVRITDIHVECSVLTWV